MTAHELAKKLLEGPDLPVVVRDEGSMSDPIEVSMVDERHEHTYVNSFGNYRVDPHIYIR